MVSNSKIDELGRVLISKGLRKELDIIEGDDVTLVASNGKLTITKSINNCKICCNTDNLTFVNNVGYICDYCLENIKATV